MSKEIIPIERIAQSILYLRGQKVILDRDLAALYGAPTRVLNQAVKRNADRFPDDFAFTLCREEIERISQTVTSFSGLKFSKHVRAFSEQGVAMLSSVLHSDRAVKVNIAIMRAFVHSGERTRPACWRWRPRHLGLFPHFAFLKARRAFSARRRKAHAGRVRSPAHACR